MSVMEMLQNKNSSMLPEHYKTMQVEEMENRILKIKRRMGEKLFIPGHHYQKDEVIQFADTTGDSLKLAQVSADQAKAEFIVFCGVHFMAETADILTADETKVILPDMRAGCSLADMANITQTERGWEVMQQEFGDTIIPLTYINSSADIKAFVGDNGGATVTSSNARHMLEWALTQKERVLFLPDQHLGRNTARELGIKPEEMAVWDPIKDCFEYEGDLKNVKIILWKGHCSVHANFSVYNIEQTRHADPAVNVIVHPECSREVVEGADYAGSTKYIIETIENAEPGTKWAVGTEMNLVNRLMSQHKDKEVFSLNPHMCPCLTMNRIDLPHLLWTLESLAEGNVINQIQVGESVSNKAYQAITRMF
ncbi:quinolinate synthase NadA [Virgibacillus xinjiangensis]|uniref:Quinolinate synthase n=1 Tax=Virgibacillus xinjiangensis TaxID=393090 RepID=A0ABV7CRD7_9BACI